METLELHSEDATTIRDDLRQIQGIGPAIEKRLNKAGLHTYAQLGAQNTEQLAQILEEVPGHSAEHIASQRWVEQARKLADQAEKLSGEPTRSDMEDSEGISSAPGRQYYEVFTVELLVDEDNQIRRTRAKHVQTQQESTWSGWQSEPLLTFIKDQTKIKPIHELPTREALHEPVAEEKASPTIDVENAGLHESHPPVNAFQKSMHRQQKQSPMQQAGSEIYVLNRNKEEGIRSEEPFMVHLRMDIAAKGMELDNPAQYEAEIYAKQLGGRKTQLVGKAKGEVLTGNPIQIDVPAIGIPQGVYRMEALVSIYPQQTLGDSPPVVRAMSESSLFYVR